MQQLWLKEEDTGRGFLGVRLSDSDRRFFWRKKLSCLRNHQYRGSQRRRQCLWRRELVKRWQSFNMGLCRKDFKYPKALQTHMAGNCEKSFQCSKYDTTFSSKKDLNQHIIGYHKDSNDNIHKRDHCESPFKSSGGLRRHKKTFIWKQNTVVPCVTIKAAC